MAGSERSAMYVRDQSGNWWHGETGIADPIGYASQVRCCHPLHPARRVNPASVLHRKIMLADLHLQNLEVFEDKETGCQLFGGVLDRMRLALANYDTLPSDLAGTRYLFSGAPAQTGQPVSSQVGVQSLEMLLKLCGHCCLVGPFWVSLAWRGWPWSARLRSVIRPSLVSSWNQAPGPSVVDSRKPASKDWHSDFRLGYSVSDRHSCSSSAGLARCWSGPDLVMQNSSFGGRKSSTDSIQHVFWVPLEATIASCCGSESL